MPTVEPRILASARKHGVGENDIKHALEFPMRHYDLDDDRVLVLGPDTKARLLEVVVAEPDGDARVIHAMPIRPRFIRHLEGRDQP